jgi:hypothetical protein
MNWFKIKINAKSLGLGPEHVYGSSEENLESLEEQARQGRFIRLDNPLYMEGNEYKKWTEWEKPLVSINGRDIVYLMQFNEDPSLDPNVRWESNPEGRLLDVFNEEIK